MSREQHRKKNKGGNDFRKLPIIVANQKKTERNKTKPRLKLDKPQPTHEALVHATKRRTTNNTTHRAEQASLTLYSPRPPLSPPPPRSKRRRGPPTPACDALPLKPSPSGAVAMPLAP